MFRTLTGLQRSAAFTVIALILAIGLALSPYASTIAYMHTPTVAALLMLFVVTGEGYSKEGWRSLGLHRLGLKAWPFALLAPFLINGLGFLLLIGTGLATYTGLDPEIAAKLGSMPVSAALLLDVVTGLVIGIFTGSLGEELGWRGYLLPRLREMGEGKALLVSGLIWAVWHLPLMLLTTQYHAGQNLWLYFPLFMLAAIGMGSAIGYTRLRTESVWPAVMMHTAANLAWNIYRYFYTSNSTWAEVVSGDAGLVQFVLYGAVALWVMRRMAKRK